MKLHDNGKRIDTTLGDLIATISDIVFDNSNNPEQAYALTHLVLMEMLKTASFNKCIDRRYPTNRNLH